MKNNQHIWRNWIAVLDRWGFQEIAATLLEATGPLNFVGAQVVYLGQPVLNLFFPDEQISAFADLLNNPAEIKTFIDSLRKRSQVIDH